MQRRQFIKSAVGVGIGLAVGSAVWTSIPSGESPLTLAAARDALARVMADNRTSAGQWSLAMVFEHMAQSIEYSMLGYPEHKPAWFKVTIGAGVFALFSEKGRMKHNLAEAIPGAPALSGTDVTLQYQRLQASIDAFEQYEGELQPHFAYGQLSKAQYEQAHVMHIFNHLEDLV